MFPYSFRGLVVDAVDASVFGGLTVISHSVYVRLGIWQSLVRCIWRLKSAHWIFPEMTSRQCSIFFVLLGSTAGTC